MLGPVANSAAIIIGALAGTLSSQIFTVDMRKKLTSVLGCVTLYIGVSMASKGNALPPVILSLFLGTLFGEIMHLESLLMRLSIKAASLFRNRKTNAASLPQKAIEDQMAVATILFCASGLGVLGPIREGMTQATLLSFLSKVFLTALLPCCLRQA